MSSLSRKTVRKDLRDYVLADGDVAALISDRYFQGVAEQGTPLPYLVLHGIFGAPVVTHDGDMSLDEQLVQFDAVAETAQEAMEVRDALVALLGASRFTQGDTEFVTRCVSERDVERERVDKLEVYRMTIDFDVSAKAAAAAAAVQFVFVGEEQVFVGAEPVVV